MSREGEAFNYLTNIAIFMGVSLFTVLLILLISDPGHFLSSYGGLLSALFILIASGIASASVMKSIQANKELKENETFREDMAKRNYIIAICTQIKKNNESIIEVIGDSEISTFERNFIEDQLHSSLELAKKIFNDRYMVIIQHNNNNEFMITYNSLNLFHKLSTNNEVLKDNKRDYEKEKILSKIDESTKSMDAIIINLNNNIKDKES